MDSNAPVYAPVDTWRTFWRYRLPGFLGNLFPRTHWTVYILNDGAEQFCLWKQWGNRCYGVVDFVIDPAERRSNVRP